MSLKALHRLIKLVIQEAMALQYTLLKTDDYMHMRHTQPSVNVILMRKRCLWRNWARVCKTFLRGCKSRRCLQILEFNQLGECWNGLQSGLKIRAPKGVVGSNPTSPTTSQLISKYYSV